jgi:NAD(P)-dependent dehydrogenase (short-subunit alcohol dehydrogenase family)
VSQRTILVTGAASGICAATAARLRDAGHRAIGADLRNTEIEADLGTPAGRATLVEQAERLAPDGLDGVIAGAGVVKLDDPALMIAVNYFGAVATLEGLRPLLARSPRPRAAAIVSTAALLPASKALVAACLAGDEQQAKTLSRTKSDSAYACSKLALALWLRRAAITPEWAGSGILLNGVGPGGVVSPMTEAIFATAEGRAMMHQVTPIAVPTHGLPDDIAEVLDFLVNLQRNYLLGQIIFTDGGTDAILRPEPP